MADENQLSVRIVLDDGSIQSGFIRVQKSAEEAGQKIQKSFGDKIKDSVSNISNPTDIVAGLFLIKKTFEIVKKAAEEALDLALLGESISAVEKQFSNLADSAGLSGEKIKVGLDSASRGLVDQSDLLKLANEGILILGLNAEKLPELFALADKAAIAFGGTSVEAFDKITTAISTGNLRALKDFGLKLDLTKQYEKFEKDNLIAAGSINEAQKQQIALNAVLKLGESRFKDVSVSLTPVADSLKRTKNQFIDLEEAIGKVANIAFGPAITSIANGIGAVFEKTANGVKKLIGGPVEETQSQIRSLSSELEKLRDLQKDNVKSYSPTGVLTDVVNVNDQYRKLNKQLEEAKTRLDLFQGTSKSNGALDPKEAQAGNEARAKLALDLIKQQEFQKQVDAKIKSEQLTAEAAHQKSLNDLKNIGATDYQKELNNQAAAEVLINNKRDQDKLKNETDYLINRSIQQKEFDALEKISKQKQADDLALIKEQSNQRIISSEINVSDSFANIAKGFDATASSIAASAQKNFQQAGAQAFNTFGSGVANAFSNVGKAIAKGENALEAFGNSFVATMGQMAVQMGTTFILQGIAATWAPGPAAVLGITNGPALIAAGAALAAFGGILSAASGGGSEAGASSGGGSTAGASSGGGTDIGGQVIDNNQRQSQGAKVDINIQGNMIGSNKDVATYISDILNEQFKNGGVVFGAT